MFIFSPFFLYIFVLFSGYHTSLILFTGVCRLGRSFRKLASELTAGFVHLGVRLQVLEEFGDGRGHRGNGVADWMVAGLVGYVGNGDGFSVWGGVLETAADGLH